MRKTGRWICMALVTLSILVYLRTGRDWLYKISQWEHYITCSIENVQSQEKEEWGISAKNAFSHLKKEEQREEPLSLVFWREKKNQTIENEELSRQGSFSVIELCGNSALLFPGEYPLNKEDTQGCLIGEAVANQLFGDVNVVGKTLVYGDKTYSVRGVLKNQKTFVCQVPGKSDLLLDQLTFYGNSPLEKERIKERLKTQYGLSIQESPVYWKYILIRAALFAFPAFLLTVFLYCSRRSKVLQKGLLWMEILFFLAGLVFIFDITPEKLPNRLSDFDFWVEAVEKGWKDLKLFFL